MAHFVFVPSDPLLNGSWEVTVTEERGSIASESNLNLTISTHERIRKAYGDESVQSLNSGRSEVLERVVMEHEMLNIVWENRRNGGEMIGRDVEGSNVRNEIEGFLEEE